MNLRITRRTAACAAIAGAFTRMPSFAKPRRPVRMHPGTQGVPLEQESLEYLKRHAVDHIAGWPLKWTEATMVDDLSRARDLCEKFGIRLDVAEQPRIHQPPASAIALGRSPERDREIDYIHKVIVACSKAGIPSFKYILRILFNVRTGTTPGRGGARYSTWRWKDVTDADQLTEAGRVDADAYWERITYFLDRVIPVCNEYKIRAQGHPHDPGVPKSGYRGVDRVLGTVEGLKRFVSIQESPYHGLNLCVGTVAEMLSEPAREIHGVIRYFGQRKKIFNVHFRNIVGKRDDFYEVYPDNGDMNMIEVARTLWEVDYPYMLMPDHMPTHPGDPDLRQAFAFGYGYIKAVIQALETLG
ncbi:MAG: TIM barrel protein [Acidobacteria bacterium]|nr:TIM barrel protein [Acidobacteriota bacterium]